MPKEASEENKRWEGLAKDHYENFPVGSFLVPRAKRGTFKWIYAFARTADDLADEEQDLAGLKALRRGLEIALEGETPSSPENPGPPRGTPIPFGSLTLPLARCVRTHHLSPDHFHHLLDAFELDLRKNRYGDIHELFAYCQLSANPVGRLVLELFETRDDKSFALSDQICTALQILNHLQDLRSDYLERNRVYLPADHLHALGIQDGDLAQAPASPPLKALIQELAQTTAALLVEGHPLCDRLPGRASLEIRAIFHSAGLVLERLEASGFDPLSSRPKVKKSDFPGILFRALRKAGPSKKLRKLAERVSPLSERR